jgi:thiamine biosynthesis lipoprotein
VIEPGTVPTLLATFAMGTRFELLFDGAREVGESALAIVDECDARYSLFRSDSLLARINRDAFERPVRVDDETFELLSACRELRDATDGAFDVCVEPWMRSRGFRGAASESNGERGTFELDVPTRSVRFTTSNTALDLGAIAKGHALDLAAAELRACGVKTAFMHGGTSSVIAIGTPPGERGWRVALGTDADAPIAVLRDDALSVSAPRGRTIASNGVPIGHILDPRDGTPVALTSFAAAVGASARTAEAWSTALLVLAARSDRAPRVPPALQYVLRRDAAAEWTLDHELPPRFELRELQPR